MVTKPSGKLENIITALILHGLIEKKAQTSPEVKSYKHLEQTNRVFEKKNNRICSK